MLFIIWYSDDECSEYEDIPSDLKALKLTTPPSKESQQIKVEKELGKIASDIDKVADNLQKTSSNENILNL